MNHFGRREIDFLKWKIQVGRRKPLLAPNEGVAEGWFAEKDRLETAFSRKTRRDAVGNSMDFITRRVSFFFSAPLDTIAVVSAAANALVIAVIVQGVRTKL